MPSTIEAANNSPPVEIAILNYNSPDDLDDYFYDLANTTVLADGNILSYRKYTGRDYYHTSHANNLSVLMSMGEYVIIGCTDMYLHKNYFIKIREILATDDFVWLQANRELNFVVCRRDEFMEAGGFDERFEFYSPNDKDFESRLRRRGGKCGYYSPRLLGQIHTPKEEKYKNYRVTSRLAIKKIVNPIFLENEEKGILVANEGEEWGSWK